MNARVYLILVLSTWIIAKSGFTYPTIGEYINEKWRNTKREIARAIIKNFEDISIQEIQWNRLWSDDIESHQALTLDILNEMFVLVEDNRIMSVGVELNANKSVKLKEVSLTHHRTPVKFLRTHVWNNTLYLLLCYTDDDNCAIYTANGDYQLHYHQSIKQNSVAVDAHFFVANHQLYLIVANNFGDYYVPSVIYAWIEDYMKIIKTISLANVVSITSFNSDYDTITMIFGEKEQHINIDWQVYEFNSTNKSLRRIQYLPTEKAVSYLHHYIYQSMNFILVIDEIKPACVFWWEGKEFIRWFEVDEIFGRDINLKNVYINNETFIIIAKQNILSVYKITSGNFHIVNVTKFENIRRIVDFRVWTLKNVISLVLVIERMKNLYRVEPWQLAINSTIKVDDSHKNREINRFITELKRCLKKNMKIVENNYETWRRWQSRSIDRILKIHKVHLNSTNKSINISNIILNNQTITPRTLRVRLVKDLAEKVENLLTTTRMLPQHKNNGTIVISRLSIEGNAEFQTLQTSTMNTHVINGVNINDRMKKIISRKKNEKIAESLKARHVIIHELKIDSLCGIPEKYWLLKNDSLKMPLKPVVYLKRLNESLLLEINDESVKIKSNVSYVNFKTQILDSINLREFFDNLFIIGERQIIRGNVIYHKNLLTVSDLKILRHLDGASINDLITLTTNQHFVRPIKIDSLEVFDLRADKINGVSMDDAAKVQSEDNIIYGQVILDNLIVTDELHVDDPSAIIENQRQIQMYDEVRIRSNVVITNLKLATTTDLILEGEKIKGYELDDILTNSWSTSSDQIISSPVLLFDKGLTIDEIKSISFNGYNQKDYLYTNTLSLPGEFGNINFLNVIINSTRNNNKKLYDISHNYLLVNKKVHFETLAMKKLHTKTYNGMSIDVIMKSKINDQISRNLYLPDSIHFRNLIVNDKLIVKNLFYKMPHHSSEESDVLFIDDDNIDDYYSRNFIISNLHAENTVDDSELDVDVMIEGELIVDELNIQEFINDESVDVYLDNLSKKDIHISSENNQQIFIDKLTVLHDSHIDYLEGEEFNYLMKSIFYKSKNQKLSTMIFNKIKTNNLQANKINGISFNQLKFINEPMFFHRDIIFTNLSADVKISNLNGLNINNYIHKTLIAISAGKINNLHVIGSISWDENKFSGLTELLNNAVNFDENQTIEAKTIFSSQVLSQSISSIKQLNPDIQSIIEDAVTVNSNSMTKIHGKKVIQGSLIAVGNLNINYKLNVNQLETMTIAQLNESIVKLSDEEKNIDYCTFIGECKISHLIVPNLGPGMPNISAFFFLTADDENHILPMHIHFQKLTVLGNVTLHALDGMDFNKFIVERVTLNGNHHVFDDIVFNGSIRVEEAIFNTINGVFPDALIVNGTQVKQIVDGETIFHGELEVEDLEFHDINLIDRKQIYVYNSNTTELQIFTDSILSLEKSIIKGRDLAKRAISNDNNH